MERVIPEKTVDIFNKFHETYEEIKPKIDEKILKNPRFEQLFINELKYVFVRTSSFDYDVVVAPDRKSVSISSYSSFTNLASNNAFIRIVFSLKDDRILVDELNQGVMFDREEIEKLGFVVDAKYGSKLETNYSCSYINEDGIEYSNNFYSDCYPFDDDKSQIDLRERTMSSFHKPEFNEYQLAKAPSKVIRATTRNIYRKDDFPQIIHFNVAAITSRGYEDVMCSLYQCDPYYPEMLRGTKLFAKTSGKTNDDLKFEVVDNDYASIQDVYDRIKGEFKEQLDEINYAEKNQKIYEIFTKE